MNLKKLSFLVFIILSGLNSNAQLPKDRDTIARSTDENGNEYFQVRIPSIPLDYYVYKFKMSNKNSMKTVFANNKTPDFKRNEINAVCENEIAKNNKVIAAINGDFFSYNNGELNGFQITDNEMVYGYSKSVKYGINIDKRNHIRLDSVYFKGNLSVKKKNYPLYGINTYRFKNNNEAITLIDKHFVLDSLQYINADYVLLERKNKSYHFKKVCTQIPLKLMDNEYLLAVKTPNRKEIVAAIESSKKIKLDAALFSKDTDKKIKIKEHISGGVPIVLDGKKSFNKEAYLKPSRSKIHPRTALGINEKENFAVWIVVDGRSPQSKGVDYNDLSELFIENNCKKAVNLDGGGSSALWLNGKIVNIPSDKEGARPCLNYLLLVAH